MRHRGSQASPGTGAQTGGQTFRVSAVWRACVWVGAVLWMAAGALAWRWGLPRSQCWMAAVWAVAFGLAAATYHLGRIDVDAQGLFWRTWRGRRRLGWHQIVDVTRHEMGPLVSYRVQGGGGGPQFSSLWPGAQALARQIDERRTTVEVRRRAGTSI